MWGRIVLTGTKFQLREMVCITLSHRIDIKPRIILREKQSGYWSLWGCYKAQGREVIEKGYELNQLFLVVLRESSVGQS